MGPMEEIWVLYWPHGEFGSYMGFKGNIGFIWAHGEYWSYMNPMGNIGPIWPHGEYGHAGRASYTVSVATLSLTGVFPAAPFL